MRYGNAYQHAVTIVHSFIIPVAITENPMPVMPIEESRLAAEESMAELIARLRAQYPSLSISSHITYGEITDSLQEYILESKPWMVVVGNSTTEDTAFWLGSNLLSELRNLSCKVLAIPPGAKFNEVKKICLACDFKNVIGHLPAAELNAVVKHTGAKLDVLNVDHDNKEFGTNTPLESEELHILLKDSAPVYHYIDNEDVEEGINNFTRLNHTDWLVVTPHKHTFFERLFQKSHTKEIVKKVNIPILSLHEY
jgi:nucleotide-binding universal stress UspA family protein